MRKSVYNKPLEKFKNIHSGKSSILFTTGPSIKKYKSFKNSEKYIKVGLNRIYDYEDILSILDYYFFGSHYNQDMEHQKNINKSCKKYNFVKLASAYENGKSHTQINRGNVTPEDAIKMGAIPFENNLSDFCNDVSKYAMLGHSIVFPALQFILYTGISQLYLVGCDGGTTIGPTQVGDKHILGWWKRFKTFKECYYKDVKIISINPASLRGWFDDEIIE